MWSEEIQDTCNFFLTHEIYQKRYIIFFRHLDENQCLERGQIPVTCILSKLNMETVQFIT